MPRRTCRLVSWSTEAGTCWMPLRPATSSLRPTRLPRLGGSALSWLRLTSSTSSLLRQLTREQQHARTGAVWRCCVRMGRLLRPVRVPPGVYLQTLASSPGSDWSLLLLSTSRVTLSSPASASAGSACARVGRERHHRALLV